MLTPAMLRAAAAALEFSSKTAVLLRAGHSLEAKSVVADAIEGLDTEQVSLLAERLREFAAEGGV